MPKTNKPTAPDDDSASEVTPQLADTNELAGTGLFVKGKVVGRQRRTFDLKSGGKRWMISISLLTALGMQRVERWADSPAPSDIPEVGTVVTLPVAVSYYTTRAGTAVRLTWGTEHTGEQF
jgi:hypothetical protein